MAEIKNGPLTLKSQADGFEQVEFYKLLVNSIQDYAIFHMDVNGFIMTWNLGAQKLKGYTPADIIGRHFSVFYSEADVAAGIPPEELVVCARDGHFEDEGFRYRQDGSRFWANVIITALRDETGKLVGFAKVTRDLTERKRKEDELRVANQRLQLQSEKLALINESKDEFISLASHQLRTPATGVKQFLGLLLQGYAGPLSEQQADYVQRAYEGNCRQIDLVNDLLRVAQVDAGKVVLDRKRLNITPFIEDIINEQIDSFKNRTQQVELDLPSDPVYATVDEHRFRMVLENLIDNASKYTPAGGVVKIAVQRTADQLHIAISDTGIGIAEESMPKLFNKFSRIPNELSDSVGGSGLGLYWAGKITELHGGRVEVQSQAGQGSTFTVLIPEYSQ